ncbi:MAG: hypothetical protein SNJ69_03110, partial [Chloroflexaceae bacterium]
VSTRHPVGARGRHGAMRWRSGGRGAPVRHPVGARARRLISHRHTTAGYDMLYTESQTPPAVVTRIAAARPGRSCAGCQSRNIEDCDA